MGKILAYQNDKDRRFCEIALTSGEHLHLQVDENGVVIEHATVSGKPADLLFKGNPEVVTYLCTALLKGTPAGDNSVLDILASVVNQLPTAEHVRDAFRTATETL